MAILKLPQLTGAFHWALCNENEYSPSLGIMYPNTEIDIWTPKHVIGLDIIKVNDIFNYKKILMFGFDDEINPSLFPKMYTFICKSKKKKDEYGFNHSYNFYTLNNDEFHYSCPKKTKKLNPSDEHHIETETLHFWIYHVLKGGNISPIARKELAKFKYYRLNQFLKLKV